VHNRFAEAASSRKSMVQIHGNDTVFQTTTRISRLSRIKMLQRRALQHSNKRQLSHRALGGPNRKPENLSKDTNERKR
jgi:hypothetical protein